MTASHMEQTGTRAAGPHHLLQTAQKTALHGKMMRPLLLALLMRWRALSWGRSSRVDKGSSSSLVWYSQQKGSGSETSLPRVHSMTDGCISGAPNTQPLAASPAAVTTCRLVGCQQTPSFAASRFVTHMLQCVILQGLIDPEVIY